MTDDRKIRDLMSSYEKQDKVIALGCDHAAFATKEKLKRWLMLRGYTVKDFGTDSEKSCDYPDIAQKVARAVKEKEVPQAILMCGTGLGMSYAANRFPGIRAALCWNVECASLARTHNNANILVLPSRIETVDPLEDILITWLKTPFSEEERHCQRINKIDAGV